MTTDYQRKYVESIKFYHQLHAELTFLTMKLFGCVDSMNIPANQKISLNGIAFDSSNKVKEIDAKFRELTKSKIKEGDSDDNTK